MKITFLGTSHGVPAADRFCTCTMIESGDAVYLIDAGVPVVNCLLEQGRTVPEVRALFTTHVHGDHTAGLFQFADLVDWYYKCPVDFYVADRALADAVAVMIEACNGTRPPREGRTNFIVIDPSKLYQDENIRVDFIPTKHMPETRHSYAMLVTEGERRVLFSGDLSHKLEKGDVPALLSKEPIDAFVCEMAHFDVEHILPYLESCKARAVYFQHVYPLDKYDRIRALDGKFAFSIHTPNDGDSIEL